MEDQRQDCQRELQASTRQHAEFSARLSAHQAKVEQINVRRERINAEIDEAREQFRQEQEAIAQARQLLAESIERMESDSQRREELLSTRDQIRGTLDGARQKARQDKDSAHQVAMRHQSLETQLSAMRESIERTDRQVAQLRNGAIACPRRWVKMIALWMVCRWSWSSSWNCAWSRKASWPRRDSLSLRWSISCAKLSSSGLPLSSAPKPCAANWSSSASATRRCRCSARPFTSSCRMMSRTLKRCWAPARGRE